KYWGQEGGRFTPVSRQRQVDAVRFLNANAFATPDYLLDQKVLCRTEEDGALPRVGSAPARLLPALLSASHKASLRVVAALGARPRRTRPHTTAGGAPDRCTHVPPRRIRGAGGTPG